MTTMNSSWPYSDDTWGFNMEGLYGKLMNLVDRGLVTRKVDDNGYQTFKYHRKVFFKGLWNLDDALLDARGTVFDKDNKIAQLPFKKIFNLYENGMDIYDDDWYVVSTKINGFMGAVSNHQDHILVSTTGSTTSDFVALIKKHLSFEQYSAVAVYKDYTFLFEVCDRTDPHIVEEEEGAWLIGARNKHTGDMMPLKDLSKIAKIFNFKWKGYDHMLGKDIREEAKRVQHEGFVVYEGDGMTPVLKIKSPHYLSKKALMRMGKNSVNSMYDHPLKFIERLDEEFYGIFHWILFNYEREEWAALNEQERRTILEDYFNE